MCFIKRVKYSHIICTKLLRRNFPLICYPLSHLFSPQFYEESAVRRILVLSRAAAAALSFLSLSLFIRLLSLLLSPSLEGGAGGALVSASQVDRCRAVSGRRLPPPRKAAATTATTTAAAAAAFLVLGAFDFRNQTAAAAAYWEKGRYRLEKWRKTFDKLSPIVLKKRKGVFSQETS